MTKEKGQDKPSQGGGDKKVEHGHEGKSADQGRTDKSFGESYRTHGQGEPPPVEVEPEEPEK